MVSGLKDDHNRSVCVDGAELGRGRSRSAIPLGGLWSIQWSCHGLECQGLGVPTLSAMRGCPERKDLFLDEAALHS